jgi:hypothetical protein
MLPNKLGVVGYGLKREHMGVWKFFKEPVSINSDVAPNVQHKAIASGHGLCEPAPFAALVCEKIAVVRIPCHKLRVQDG